MWAVVVAQLAERSLLIPEVCGSNPVIDNFFNALTYLLLTVEKTKINKMRPIFITYFECCHACATSQQYQDSNVIYKHPFKASIFSYSDVPLCFPLEFDEWEVCRGVFL